MINIVTKILIINKVANPLTLLSPKINRIIATINVVKLESKIVQNDSLFPNWKAISKSVPLYNSSRIREYVMTFASTAIPIPMTNAAIPGRVNTPPISQYIPNVSKV